MKINYLGFGSRILARDTEDPDYVWMPGEGSVEVEESDVVLNLLTYPRPDFEVADDEPLFWVVKDKALVENLVAAGIHSIDELIAVDNPMLYGEWLESIGVDLLAEWQMLALEIIGDANVNWQRFLIENDGESATLEEE